VNNTGRINGEVMHRGNWVSYTGPDMGVNSIWRPGNVLQWDGRVWRLVRLEADSAGMYWTALRDILQGAPRSFASLAMMEQLVSSEAFIEYLQVLRIVLQGNGEISSLGFNGIDGSVPGFLIRAIDGLIEANNMRTRNMRATNAKMEGTLVAGSVWDIDGNLINANQGGALLAEHHIDISNPPVRVHNLTASGSVQLGTRLPGQTGTSVLFLNAARQRQNNAFLLSRGLSGTQTRADLFSWLDTMFPIPQSSAMPWPGGFFYPLIGNVHVNAMTVNISYVGRETGEWWLYGMGTDGIRYAVFVPNSGNMLLLNRGGSTDPGSGSSVGGTFASAMVDLVVI